MKKNILSLLLLSLLAACSLAEDITPPPGYQPQVQATFNAPATNPTAVAPIANATPIDVSNVVPTTLPSATAGSASFAKNCIRCHGATGAGDGQLAGQIQVPLPNFAKSDLARTTTPQRWYGIITNGNLDRFMPPWTSLSESERWNLAAYLYTLSTPATQLDAGKKVFESNCQTCHAATGKGGNPEVKVDFTNPAFMVKKSNNELFAALPKVSAHKFDSLSEAERRAAIDYVRAFSYESVPVIADKGTVTGKVVNSTPGSKLPSDLAVVLNVFENFQPSESITVTAKSDGGFAFTDVKLNDKRAFIVSVKYGEIIYVSDVTSVVAGTQAYTMPVEIFETANDPAVLRIDQFHIIFDFSNGSAQVGELIVLSNLSDRTFLPKTGEASLALNLPNGFTNLSFEGGPTSIKQTATGFSDTRPVRPGNNNYELVASYRLPYVDKYSFAQTLPYAANTLSVLLPDVGVTLANSKFEDRGVRDMQGTKFRTYTLTNAKAGEVIKFDLTGSPSLASAATDSPHTFDSTSTLIGGSALGLALAIVALYYWNQLAGSKTKTAPVTNKNLKARRDELVTEIADLDEGFEKGEYPAEEYQRERAKLKEELKELLEKSEK